MVVAAENISWLSMTKPGSRTVLTTGGVDDEVVTLHCDCDLLHVQTFD